MPNEESIEERLKSAEKKAKGISDEKLRDEVMQEIEGIKKKLQYLNEPPEITRLESSISRVDTKAKIIFCEDEFGDDSYAIYLVLPDKRVKDVIYKKGFIVDVPEDYKDSTFKDLLDYICNEYSRGRKPIQTLKNKLKQGKDLELAVKLPVNDEETGEEVGTNVYFVELDDNIEDYITEGAVSGLQYDYDGFRLDVKW